MFEDLLGGLSDLFSGGGNSVSPDTYSWFNDAASNAADNSNLFSNIGSSADMFQGGSVPSTGESWLSNALNNPQAVSNTPLLNSSYGWLNNLTTPSSLAKIGTGIYNMYDANKRLNTAQSMYSPIINQSNQARDQLSALMANPNSINNNPAFKAMQTQSEEALKRNAAATGYLGSGNVLLDLQKNAQNNAYNFYNQEANRLQSLAQPQYTAMNGLSGLSAAKSAQNTANIASLAKLFGL